MDKFGGQKRTCPTVSNMNCFYCENGRALSSALVDGQWQWLCGECSFLHSLLLVEDESDELLIAEGVTESLGSNELDCGFS